MRSTLSATDLSRQNKAIVQRFYDAVFNQHRVAYFPSASLWPRSAYTAPAVWALRSEPLYHERLLTAPNFGVYSG